MATLKEILSHNDLFAQSNGVVLCEVGEGYARAQMHVTRRHLNAAGVCQGGALFTLADLAFAAATNSHGQVTLGVQNSVSYLRSAREGDVLTAEAREEYHHRLPFCEIRITNQEEQIVCVVTGSAYRKKDSFDYEALQ